VRPCGVGSSRSHPRGAPVRRSLERAEHAGWVPLETCRHSLIWSAPGNIRTLLALEMSHGPGPVERAPSTLLFAGLRLRELLERRLRDVDMNEGRLFVRDRKTPAAAREIRMLQTLVGGLGPLRAPVPCPRHRRVFTGHRPACDPIAGIGRQQARYSSAYHDHGVRRDYVRGAGGPLRGHARALRMVPEPSRATRALKAERSATGQKYTRGVHRAEGGHQAAPEGLREAA
jgi:hypothetical protein